MDDHRRAHRARAGVARRRRACTPMVRAEVEALCRKFPLYPDNCWPETHARRRASSPTTARWRGPSPEFEPRAGPARDGRGRRPRLRRAAASCSPRRAPAPARRSPTSSRPSSAASACSSRPAPRTCRNRSTSRTCPLLREALGVPFTATYMKGRGELPVPAPLRRDCATTSRPARRRTASTSPMVDDWAADDRDRATAPSSRTCPRTCRSGASIAATTENCLGTRLPALRRLLRHAHAPARRRLRRRHRQPPPAVRRRRRAPERVRRGDPRPARTP